MEIGATFLSHFFALCKEYNGKGELRLLFFSARYFASGTGFGLFVLNLGEYNAFNSIKKR